MGLLGLMGGILLLGGWGGFINPNYGPMFVFFFFCFFFVFFGFFLFIYLFIFFLVLLYLK